VPGRASGLGEEMGPLPISLRKQVANLCEYNGNSAGEEMGPLPIFLRKQVAKLYEYNASAAGVFSWHE
jgi:hypothetical protein